MNTMNSKRIGTAVVALIVGAGIGYLIPHGSTGPQGANAQAGSFSRGGTFMLRGGNQANGGFLTGTVAKADANSITVNTRDGSSHVVLLTPDTTYSKSAAGSASDVTVGSDVIVSGTTNSDGSVSANLVQLRPAGANGPMIPAPAP